MNRVRDDIGLGGRVRDWWSLGLRACARTGRVMALSGFATREDGRNGASDEAFRFHGKRSMAM